MQGTERSKPVHGLQTPIRPKSSRDLGYGHRERPTEPCAVMLWRTFCHRAAIVLALPLRLTTRPHELRSAVYGSLYFSKQVRSDYVHFVPWPLIAGPTRTFSHHDDDFKRISGCRLILWVCFPRRFYICSVRFAARDLPLRCGLLFCARKPWLYPTGAAHSGTQLSAHVVKLNVSDLKWWCE